MLVTAAAVNKSDKTFMIKLFDVYVVWREQWDHRSAIDEDLDARVTFKLPVEVKQIYLPCYVFHHIIFNSKER